MIPSKFTLMAHEWTVEQVHGPFDVDGDLCNGACDFQTLNIRVNVDLAPSLVMHALMHEIMHAVLWSIGHELATNENFVDAVGCAMAQVMLTAECAE